MIRIAIVEDNAQEQAHLRSCLEQYQHAHDLSFQIDTYSDGLDLIEHYTGLYQLIFLDIQLKWLDGMETARRIRALDADTVLIFVTNLAQYAVEGYDVDSRAYLVKPVSYHVLSRQLDRFCQTLEQQEQAYLLLSNSREMQRIRLGSIYYTESTGHFIHIHTTQTVVRVHIPLRSVEEKLDTKQFVRCNSGTIINLAHLESVTGHEALVAGTRLPISRNRKKPLMDAMADYLGG